MNERIKELMKGCFDVTVDSRGREECCADYANVQRFADRIIMECAELSTNLKACNEGREHLVFGGLPVHPKCQDCRPGWTA